jgi:hypothetical protein
MGGCEIDPVMVGYPDYAALTTIALVLVQA